MRSKSSLFLIEQIIVIAVFAICAVVCVKIFAESHIISSTGADINNALLLAKSGAESFKAAPNDTDVIAELLGVNLNRQYGQLFAYYDNTWRPCDAEDALYILSFMPYDGTGDEASLAFCRLTVEQIGDGALSGTIVELTVATQPVTHTSEEPPLSRLS